MPRLVDVLAGEVVLLDNIEVLFDLQLAWAVRLLQGLARKRTLVDSWPGGY